MERDVANIEGLYVEGIKLDRFCEASVVGLGLILIQVLGPAAVKIFYAFSHDVPQS